MIKILFIIISIFILNNINAQSANFEYNLNSDRGDYFSDFLKVNNYYLITASQTDIDSTSSSYNNLHNIFIKVSENGTGDITELDTFGTDIMNWTTVLYNDTLYTISSEKIYNDSIMLSISKRDTNFNLISKTVYPNIKRPRLQFNQRTYLNDSILLIFGTYTDVNLDYYSIYIEVNLKTMCIQRNFFFNEKFFITDYVKPEKPNNYYNFIALRYGGNFQVNTIVKYDSAFNYIDTINLPYLIKGNSDILSYHDSLFLLSGHGQDDWDIPNYTNINLQLQVLDSNYNFISAQSVSIGNVTSYQGVRLQTAYTRSLIRNNDGDFFTGGFLRDIYFMFPNVGVLVAKLDSNLGLIWKKHIPGNAHYSLARMMPTDDGGVVFIVAKRPVAWNDYNSDASLMKIGPNGEVTSIIDLKMLNNKPIIKLYPNPVDDVLSISMLSNRGKIHSLNISDINGKTLLQKQASSKEAKLDVSNLSSGIYILQGITDLGQQFSRKFVKE